MLLHYTCNLCPILHFSPTKTNHAYYYNHINVKLISDFGNSIGVTLPLCKARRRVRYEDEGENEDEGYGYNEEVAMLEVYSQSARGEALLVNAVVDGQEVEVLIFKGFSSCLSYKTSPDPSKSVLPQRAVIKSIDRIRGPFDPTNIDYIEKGLAWETFRSRIFTKK